MRRRRSSTASTAAGRSPRGADARASSSDAGSTRHPAARAAAGHRAGLRRRLVRAARRASASCRWSELLAPAIRYAREGFPVTEVIAALLGARRARCSRSIPGFARARSRSTAARRARARSVSNPNLARHARGDRRRRPRRLLQGRHRAHDRRLLARRNGGFLPHEDLAAHRGEWVEPVSTNYRGYDVWELPPNGQGIAALQMLNMLEGYDLKTHGLRQRRATCTCSSRPRSSPSRTARASTPIRRSPSCRSSG